MKNFSLLISTLTTLLLSPAFFPVVHSTTFTFVNKCNYTVWPGILSTSPNSPTLSTTGFSLQKNDSTAIPVPTGWAGRLWGRTYCSQNSTGKFSCVTGDCGSGKVECSGSSGAPPATLAEFTLSAGADLDYYDVSLIQGYNLPMMVVPQGSAGEDCNSTGCAADLNGSCPSELRVTSAGQSGKTVACRSACDAYRTPEYCCTGAYSSPETCKPTSYSEVFKRACPTAYSYAYDDGTSTFSCANADYVITFCPSLNISSEQRQSPELNNGTSPSPFQGGSPELNNGISPSPFEGGSPELNNGGSPSGKKPLLVIILVPVIITILVSSALSFYYYMRRRTSRLLEEKHNIRNRELLASELNALGELGDTSQPKSSDKDNKYPFFSFSVIKAATSDFSIENKLGQGGFGPVYKGQLKNGKEIAVKRLSRSSSQGIRQFRNEVLLISKLQHRNLVRLLGCCIQGEERLLIYEYLPNNSLDSFIFDATKKALLDWSKRFSIIQGIAQGLLYLHKYSRLRIIHRDLKTSNILLDNELNPKISDFGTARIFGDNESSANTGTIVGTYGYMSPEYAMEGLFSEKSDVFSYGVMMLEIIGSRKNTSFYHCNRFVNLLGYAWDLWKEGKSLELMDSGLQEEPMPQNEVVRCIHIALMCVQENATDRPNMSEVVFMLTQDTTNLPAPKQPAFTVNTSAIEERPNQDLMSVSVNEVTISEIQGR